MDLYALFERFKGSEKRMSEIVIGLLVAVNICLGVLFAVTFLSWKELKEKEVKKE